METDGVEVTQFRFPDGNDVILEPDRRCSRIRVQQWKSRNRHTDTSAIHEASRTLHENEIVDRRASRRGTRPAAPLSDIDWSRVGRRLSTAGGFL